MQDAFDRIPKVELHCDIEGTGEWTCDSRLAVV
jgi:hypothetical protein